jgi:threonine/homoserine/homoserine lactone efflux protein
MSLESGLVLALTLMGLAALPSASVALVVAQTASRGVASGLGAAAGIVAADLVFVLFALAGMSALAESLGAFFVLFRVVGALYLIWLGGRLLGRSRRRESRHAPGRSRRHPGASFLAGLLLTFGDLKAILFYASFFPQMVDLTAVGIGEIAILVLLTVVSIGSVKAAYALAARPLHRRWRGRGGRSETIRTLGGGALVAIGAGVLAKT